MPDRLITADGPRGQIKGWVQVVSEAHTVYSGCVIVRDPHTRHLRVFDLDESLKTLVDEWQILADRGPIYSDAGEPERVQHRAAMASWWRAVQAWIDEET